MEDTPHSLTRKIRALNKVFRLACSQVILLNHRIEAVKARYDRACAVKRLSFRYCNRLKLTSLQGVRNVIYEYVIQKSEEILLSQRQLSDFMLWETNIAKITGFDIFAIVFIYRP